MRKTYIITDGERNIREPTRVDVTFRVALLKIRPNKEPARNWPVVDIGMRNFDANRTHRPDYTLARLK